MRKEKEEKIMIDINSIIRLRNLLLTAINITKNDMAKYKEGTPSYSYSLGILHCQEDFKAKLNELIIQGK